MQGVQSVGDGDAMFGAAVGREFGLERLQFAAEQVPARFHDAVVRRVHFGAEFLVRGL